ncbi:MAG TPA: hypothetical protein VNS79_11445 [Sphingobium sp.]|nr:hypothetical protein [Sphingobium sp.]
MSISATGPHLSSDPDRLHQFLPGSAVAESGPSMSLDAIRTLRDMGDGERDDLFGLRWQSTVRKNHLTESFEGSGRFRCQFSTQLREIVRRSRVDCLCHVSPSPKLLRWANAPRLDEFTFPPGEKLSPPEVVEIAIKSSDPAQDSTEHDINIIN